MLIATMIMMSLYIKSLLNNYIIEFAFCYDVTMYFLII